MQSPRFPGYSEEELTRRIVQHYVTRQRSVRFIAEGYELSYTSVRRALAAAGVKLRPCGRPIKEVKLRQCMDCGQEKLLSEFEHDSSNRLRHGYRCGECSKLRLASLKRAKKLR